MSLVPIRPKVSIEGMIVIHIMKRMGIMWERYYKSDFKFTELKTEPTDCVIVYDDMSKIFDNPESLELLKELARKRKV